MTSGGANETGHRTTTLPRGMIGVWKPIGKSCSRQQHGQTAADEFRHAPMRQEGVSGERDRQDRNPATHLAKPLPRISGCPCAKRHKPDIQLPHVSRSRKRRKQRERPLVVTELAVEFRKWGRFGSNDASQLIFNVWVGLAFPAAVRQDRAHGPSGVNKIFRHRVTGAGSDATTDQFHAQVHVPSPDLRRNHGICGAAVQSRRSLPIADAATAARRRSRPCETTMRHSVICARKMTQRRRRGSR